MKLVANINSNICRIYHYDKHPAQLRLLKEIDHPENKLKSGDITSDRPGHYQSRTSARGAYSPHMEAKEIEIDNFSREITKELNQERIKKEYDELIVIAPPHMIGLLFQHINKHVKNLVINDIKKDLIHLSDHELLIFLQSHTQYHDKLI
jgi:protein required for attachment to host cells